MEPQRRPHLPIMHAVYELVEYQCIKIAKAQGPKDLSLPVPASPSQY